MSSFKDHFSSASDRYAAYRPVYPAALFAWLAGLCPGPGTNAERGIAWDCATGSGQAALGLVPHFRQVVATDASAEQIRHAAPHPRIDYRVAPAEACGLADHSVDLVTVAQAAHWFDLDRFYAEARRVLRADGVLAAWTYHVGHVAPPFDALFGHFYRDVLASYFAPGARLVDDRYEGVTLPGAPIEFPSFEVSAAWDLDRMLAFISSWSGTLAYREARGADPVALIAPDLERLWGPRDRVRAVRWPLYVRVSRL